MSIEKEWTILFLVQIRNALDHDYFVSILQKIKSISLGEGIQVVLCINFQSRFRSSFIATDPYYSANTNQKMYSTCIFKLEAHSNTQANSLEIIEEIENFDISSAFDVGKLFIRKMTKKFEAKRLLLFTWDHGNGYAIFKKNRNGYNSRLTLRKLNRAIEIGLQGERRMDIVVMMNCWMQFIDTSYALKDNVHYLIAAQDNVELNIYDIRSMIEAMAQTPNISNESLGKYIVQCVRSKELSNTKTVALSAINLKKLEGFFDTLDLLAIALKKEIGIDNSDGYLNKEMLLSVRSQFALAHVLDTGNKFIDFYSLIKNLKVKLQPKYAILCQYLLDQFNLIIIEFFTNHPKKDQNNWDKPHGLNICSPFTILPHEKSRDGFELERVANIKDTEFVQTAWGRLMKILRKLDFEIISGHLD